jgi:hypothetical protein
MLSQGEMAVGRSFGRSGMRFKREILHKVSSSSRPVRVCQKGCGDAEWDPQAPTSHNKARLITRSSM